jgi:GNAT superfamily N-acetyltransferase
VGVPVSPASLPSGILLRRATADDAGVLGRAVIEGFGGYRSFAPDGWAPPPLDVEIARGRELLASRDYWCLMAEDGGGGGWAGHISLLPAALAGLAVDEAQLAHLRNLFVRRAFWGTGLARVLLDAGVAAARERGFARMRLFTPVGQARARRFYEREGWTLHFGPFDHTGLGLQLVEYRLQRPR